MVRWTLERGLLAALLVLSSVPLSLGLSASFGDLSAVAQSAVIRSIVVEGNRRVEPETVRSYLTFSSGDTYNPAEIDQSLKTLFATGLFQDVRIRRQGGTIIVIVVENPIVNRVAFEGNREIEDATLASEVQLKPRAVYTRARVQADVQRILNLYRRQGLYAAQVDPKIINLDNNRIDVVFEINEGPTTKVRAINFIGNQAFSDSQLRFVITTTRTNFLSFLKNTNIYDPDRLNLDRELLRQFYLKNGYADVRIVSATADLDRDGRGFFITFTIEEGERYRFGYVDIESALPSLNIEALRGGILTKPGRRYNAEKVEKTVEALTVLVSEQGYAFGQVRPRFERDQATHTMNIVYVIDEGPRVYIERINIVGNFRTEDGVIRRQFRLAEGDAYNRLLVEAARKRLRALGFFKSVDIETEPGSAPDRVILVVNVVEQPTGELSFGVGYSTQEGVIGDVSITERNLMGKGQYVRLGFSGSLDRAQVDFSFTEPNFLDRNMAAGFDLFYKDVNLQDAASFNQRDAGGNLRVGFPIADNTQMGLRYRFNQQEIYDVSNNASLAVKQAADEGAVNVSSVGYTVAYDTRNLPQSPSSGIFASFSQDFAGVGGDVNYIRSVVDTRGYYPITNKITLVGRVQGGAIEGWGGDDLRLSDLFFKGGETIRGFERAGYGPRDACENPTTGKRLSRNTCQRDALGGKYFWATTAELRFPLPMVPDNLGMQGAIFVDAGSLWEPSQSAIDAVYPAPPKGEGSFIFDSSDIRLSTGFSIIWQSPLGPLRADIADALLKADFDKTELFRFGASTNF
ncbi:outer membrane protein assembly factor BamA [Methyloceanibacter superfactus]|uniref:Outer membrane protein assembly factor BamA n=1 Tax=Methyloceanibacter superfactus TaxID=1774969 RepID=A0A1E3VPD3_9HYPH|nr:outer membrane protein assembly factor BamA [Methyloceanibacter superfactus]ODR95387.1 outer membrane protein assembly factor BamA [Methyloceanibacter superfactus]